MMIARNIYQKEGSLFICFNRCSRRSVLLQFLLNSRHARVLFHSHNNIAATSIFKIIGKCADTPVYSIWIPTFFIFQLVTFYSTSIKKALYIYR